MVKCVVLRSVNDHDLRNLLERKSHLPHLEQKCLSTLLPLSVAESTYVEISPSGSRTSILSLVVDRLLDALAPVDLRQLLQ